MSELIRAAVLSGELRGAQLLAAKRDAFLGSAPQPGKWTNGKTGFVYEVVGRGPDTKRNDVVEFFVKAWMPGEKQRLVFGPRKVGIERFRFQNIPMLTEDPNGGIPEECGIDDITGQKIYRPKLIEDAILVTRVLIEQQVALTGIPDSGDGQLDEVGRTVTTFYPAAGANSPVDGQVSRLGVNDTLGQICSGAGTNASTTSSSAPCYQLVTHASNSNNYSTHRRSIYCFDTSVISEDVISEATFSLRASAKASTLGGNPDISIVSASPAATNTLASNDYSNLGSTVFSAIADSALSASGYNDFSLDANGRANIDRTGISKFGTRSNWDIGQTMDGVWGTTLQFSLTTYYADQTGTTNDPKLTVTHGAAAGATSREPQPARFKNGRWHYYGRC